MGPMFRPVVPPVSRVLLEPGLGPPAIGALSHQLFLGGGFPKNRLQKSSILIQTSLLDDLDDHNPQIVREFVPWGCCPCRCGLGGFAFGPFKEILVPSHPVP